MSAGLRSLPGRPSLRFLRLEAKRRLAAGEFPALHDAQAAVAREHGLPSWAALKQACAGSQRESHALAQLSWVISRFRDAGEPGWTAPGEAEMRQHFSDSLLSVFPADLVVTEITKVAAMLRAEPSVTGERPLQAQVRLAGMEYTAAVEAEPPHRLTGLQGVPLGERITDPRTAAPPPARLLGVPPAGVAGIADDAVAELGLPALVLAGGKPGRPPWAVAKGRADLDRAEVLDTGHRFPAPGVTALVTTIAVLRLAAAGRLRLDDPAGSHLRTVRLADDAVTVRQLLTHTGGVDEPPEFYADSVPDLAALMGPVIGCGGPRGMFSPSNGGYGVLGQLIADVAGMPYPSAAARLVLDPLGMRGSRFPASLADLGPDAVTCYTATADGVFAAAPRRLATIAAVAGLWTTGADLVRLGTGWRSLLPAALAREALTPQAGPGPGGYRVGLGWLVSPEGDSAGYGGAAFDAVALLRIGTSDDRTHVVLTNRHISVESVDERLSLSQQES